MEEEGLERCVEEVTVAFEGHLPVIVPTETLYGLACPLNDSDCIDLLFEIKGRPKGMTLPVAVASTGQIGSVGILGPEHSPIVERFLPGPLTVVLKARPDLPEGLSRNGTIAVRVPDHPLFEPLCEKVGPLVLTSANLHGRPPVQDRKEALECFEGTVALMLEDGPREGSAPSTIVDLTCERPKVLREGAVPARDIIGPSSARAPGGGL